MAQPGGIEARQAALAMLEAALAGNTGWSDLAPSLSARDAAFARRLAYGVLRWYGALDWLAGQLLSRPLKARDRDVRHLLILGIQQLWHEDLPTHASVHTTAECARAIGKPWAVGLVNAVLRRFERERDHWTDPKILGEQRHAHPPWLLDALRRDWPDRWEAVVDAANGQPPMWLRVNRTRATVAQMSERLREAGMATEPHPLATDALKLLDPVPVSQLPRFREGLLSVQDAAAQLAVELVRPEPGQRILDACAAPGGKTAHLLEREPTARVTALDVSEARAAMIGDTLERLGLNAAVLVGDAGQPDEWWDGHRYARILLDAPCSATGVIRRHPEIKWLRDPGQVREAADQQARLLDRLWPLLEPGGILVYATCSVLRVENNQQIQMFLERQSDARPIGPGWGEAVDALPGRQWLPGTLDMDGFYYVVLRRGD